jgi:tRNA pseudouridine38-40 synthase
MRNIKLIIEYDGTNYYGWQVQSNHRTIQATIQDSLNDILKEDIKLYGSGRTDSGVHAKGQVANFKTEADITAENLKKALNTKLDNDIVIKKAEEVNEDFHARFSAKSKLYRYQISQGQLSCFDRLYYSFIPYKLDIKLMKKEAKTLCGKHDFRSFQGSRRKAKDTVRTIKDINITEKGKYLYIDIEADGFLYNMVRIIVGTLIEIARGKYPKGSIKRILKAKNRKEAGPTAKSKGLFLVKVKY